MLLHVVVGLLKHRVDLEARRFQRRRFCVRPTALLEPQGITPDPFQESEGTLDALIAPLERSEEHTSELQSLTNLVCRLLLEKKKKCSVRLNPVHDGPL